MINNTVEEIRKHFESIMDLLNIERNSSNENTPLRVSKMLCNELFASRNNIGIAELDNQMKVFMCDWDESDSNAISIKDIPVHSMCFTGKTPIQTPSGVKYIKDFKVGDEVDTFNESGELETRKVTHVFKSKVDTIVKVPTSRGSSLTCTPNHPIFVLGKGWVEAKDLLKDDQIYCIRKGHNRLNRNPVTIKYGWSLGYVLGALCSDGSITRNALRLEVNSESFAQKFSDAVEDSFGISSTLQPIVKPSGYLGKDINQFRVRVVNGQISSILKDLVGGNSGSAHFKLPPIIFNSYDIFKGFFEAYIDGDGHQYTHPTNRYKYNRVSTINKDFAHEVSKIFDTPVSEVDNGNCVMYVFNLPLFINDRGTRLNREVKFKDKFHNSLVNKSPVLIYPDRVVESISGDVEYIKSRNVSYEVYNLEVQDNHTYIAKSVWVHNCEHHWLPMIGTCTVTYIPSDRVIGLSKVPRVVKYFSRKPQLQERLTTEIGEYLVSVLDPRYLSVSIDCEHMCVQMRGAEANCITSTFFDYEGK